MRKNWSARWTSAIFVGVVAACGTSEITLGGPLDLQISSNSPVSAGTPLRFEYEVVGRRLLGLEVKWGDSEPDTLVLMSGAQTASGRLEHVYAGAGTFTLMAEVGDQLEGTATKELTVTVNP